MEVRLKALKKLDQKLSSIIYAMSLISYDSLTSAPKNSLEGRASALEGLSTFYYETLINEDVKTLLYELQGHIEDFEKNTQALVKVLIDEYEIIGTIPGEEYAAFEALKARSSVAWEEAKMKDDFSIFAPMLEQVIKTVKKFVSYRNKPVHPYEVLINDYEKGLTIERADVFFDYLRKAIVPLVKAIGESQTVINDDFIKQSFPISKQKEFSLYIMEEIGFRMDSGVLAESVHPFTMNLFRDDVRITTRYMVHDMISTIASTIHETGHAIYEQNVSKDLGLSVIATGTSMGIHESQSRLFENNFGRSYPFWEKYYGPLCDTFPEELEGISLDDFYKAINVVKPSLIRVDADELTYPLHIMVRYEMEKMIMSEDIDVNDLPKLWDDKYEAYLGIRPTNNGEGILQDVHWSEGLFGYFPSYALGSAYSVQFENVMKKEIDVDQALRAGNFEPILKWLETNIHQYGRVKTPEEILKDATGESFKAEYYMTYLTDKFKGIYELN